MKYSHVCSTVVCHCATQAQKIQMTLKFQTRILGGDWSLVTKRMMEILGESARSRIGRWIRAARHLHPDLLIDLQRLPTLPDKFVFDNSYLVGDKDRLDLDSGRCALSFA